MPTVAPPLKHAAPIRHLSWSGIRDYQTCPKRFFFQRIACISEEKRSSSLVFGGAIHKAIETVHESEIEGRRLPSTKSLLSEFAKAWKDETANGPEIAYPKGDSADSLHATASLMLAAYRNHARKQAGKIIAIEQETVFPFVAGVVPIKARLDLVSIEGDDLVLSDWKTSKCRWSEAKTAESLPQLVLYAASATAMVRELGLKRIVPRFIVVTKAKTPVVQVLEPKATQDDVARLKDLVQETAKAISEDVFPRREGWQCAYCPFARRCLGRGKTLNEPASAPERIQ